MPAIFLCLGAVLGLLSIPEVSMTGSEVEKWVRGISEGKPHLLGAAISELRNAELHGHNPQFQQQVAALAIEHAGLLLATLRVMSWQNFTSPGKDDR